MRSYSTKNNDEVSVPIGSVVEVLRKSDNGWWLIRYLRLCYYKLRGRARQARSRGRCPDGGHLLRVAKYVTLWLSQSNQEQKKWILIRENKMLERKTMQGKKKTSIVTFHL